MKDNQNKFLVKTYNKALGKSFKMDSQKGRVTNRLP